MTTLPQVLENWLSPALVRAVGYALLHSLWQGAALAGLLAAALPLVRRARPEVRYAASAAALAGLLVLALGTFGYYYGHAPAPRPAALAVYFGPVAALASPAPEPAPARLPALARACEPYLPLLVAAWLLGLGLMGLRLAGGLLVAGRLRRVAVRAVGEGWQNRLAALAARAGLRRPVALLESARVRGPLVLGHLRPLILLPLGAVAGLPPALLEALLAHELAHVLRRDYLLNLLLAAVEALFFYHPAAWFMAACLRAERENCCDDHAARLVGGNRLLVAQALAALAELEATATAVPLLTLAATGSGGRASLLARVRRLALGHSQAPTLRESLLAGLLCLLGVAGLGTSMALAAPAGHPAAPMVRVPAATPADTVRRSGVRKVVVPAFASLPRPLPPNTSMSGSGYAILESGDTVQLNMRVEARDEVPVSRRHAQASRPASTIVLEKDKKGRLKSLTVDGQPVPTGEPDKKTKRSKKGETVTIIETPAAGWGTNRGWSSPLNRSWRNNTVPPNGWGFGADVAAEARRQARQSLRQTLRDPRLPADQRQALEQSLERLDATAELPDDARPRQPVPRTYAYHPSPLKPLRGWVSQQPGLFNPADQQLQQSARELARQSEQFEQQSRQTQRELAQAQRELQQVQRDIQQAQYEAQLAQRYQLQPDVRLHGEALKRLTETQRQLARRYQRQQGAASTAQRRAQLEARIEAAQAELEALNDQEDAASPTPRRAPLAPAAPKAPKAPAAPTQTAPAPPAPPAPGPPVPPPPGLTRAALRDELRREGLMGATEKNMDFEISSKEAKLNGRKLTPAEAARVRHFMELPASSTVHMVLIEK